MNWLANGYSRIGLCESHPSQATSGAAMLTVNPQAAGIPAQRSFASLGAKWRFSLGKSASYAWHVQVGRAEQHPMPGGVDLFSRSPLAPMSQSMTIRISTPHSAATGISPELTRVTADSPVRAHPAPLPTSNSAIAKCRYAIPSRIRRRSHRHVIQGLRVHRARLETRLRKSSLSAATFSTGRVFFSPSH